MKVVINKCFGGFGLSDAAVLRYLELAGKKWGEQTFYPSDLPRNDPLLVQVVEELGDKASVRHSELKVVEIPDGIQWEIEEYDGLEHVAEQHRTWG